MSTFPRPDAGADSVYFQSSVRSSDFCQSVDDRTLSNHVATRKTQPVALTPSVSRPQTSLARSSTAVPQSRPSTTVSGRKSRQSTLTSVLGSTDRQTIICALSEARGVAPSVGVALVNLSLGEAVLSQICDNQSYVKTVHKLQMAGPSRIVFMSTACPPNKNSVLYSLVDELIPDAAIELFERSAWSEVDGLDYINKLAFESDIDPIKVAIQGKYYSVSSFAAAMKFIEYTFDLSFAPNSLRIRYRPSEDTMMIDISVVQSLEILHNISNPKSKDNLFGLLDQTITPMGSRMLRSNILQPPTKFETFIGPRYDALGELIGSEEMFHSVRKALQNFKDVERILTKIITISAKTTINQAEQQIQYIITVKAFLEAVPELHQALSACKSALLVKIRDICRPEVVNSIMKRIRAVIEADVTVMSSPLDMRNARTFAVKSGINGMLDVARQTYKELTEQIHLHVNDIETHCGIRPVLKFDNGRKYWLKISSLGDGAIPPIFINAIRKKDYIECQTMPLVKLNVRLSETSNEIVVRSDVMIQGLILNLREASAELFRVCESVALVDMVASFAHLSTIRDYTRPEFTGTFAVKAGRHPILDKVMPEDLVPNDYYVSSQRCFQIVTGCNMAGKSTYIRTAALLQIMAQIGCFVPAEYASFSIIHNIFARVSLTDNLEANLSTFSVEMREMAFILRNMDEKSLIIVDELGRGTSTRDGLSIAIAMSEALIESKAFVWFATHFLDLVNVLEDRPSVMKLHLASERSLAEDGTPQLCMLYKATAGTVDATQHYGIALARALGFPRSFTDRAEEVAREMRRRREANWRNSESRKLVARRKLVLDLYEALQQAAEHGNQETLPRYLQRLQEEFITRMNELDTA